MARASPTNDFGWSRIMPMECSKVLLIAVTSNTKITRNLGAAGLAHHATPTRVAREGELSRRGESSTSKAAQKANGAAPSQRMVDKPPTGATQRGRVGGAAAAPDACGGLRKQLTHGCAAEANRGKRNRGARNVQRPDRWRATPPV